MKFSDNIIRESLEVVYVIRTQKEMEAREEYNSNIWEKVKDFPGNSHLFSIPVRDVKIGESIYNNTGNKFIAYRSE